MKRRAHILKLMMTAVTTITLLSIASMATAGNSVASKHEYQVVHVIDGDTLVASDGNVSFHVRIAAMDAPEKTQAYGKVAKIRMQELVNGKTITIEPVEKGYDRYGRVLGKVMVEGKDPALILVQEGLATYYRPTCRDYPADKQKYNYDITPYLAAEEEARKLKKNIWSDSNGVLPCKWRRLEEK